VYLFIRDNPIAMMAVKSGFEVLKQVRERERERALGGWHSNRERLVDRRL
jgi:hypothetical protein